MVPRDQIPLNVLKKKCSLLLTSQCPFRPKMKVFQLKKITKKKVYRTSQTFLSLAQLVNKGKSLPS